VSFSSIVVPFSMTHLFSIATTGGLQMPGAPFFAAAIALLAGALLFSGGAGKVGAARAGV
jgi:ABC-type Co2+ transport system permease subunit